jgi:ATP-dependent Lon protease
LTDTHDFQETEPSSASMLDQETTLTRAVLLVSDTVFLPGVITTVTLQLPAAIAVAAEAYATQQPVFLLPQLTERAEGDEALPAGIGVEGSIERLFRLPEDGMVVLLQGQRRIEILDYVQTEPTPIARAKVVPVRSERTRETLAMMQAVANLVKRVTELSDLMSDDVLFHLLNTEDPGLFADLVAASLNISLEDRLRMLQTVDTDARLHHVAILLGQQLSILELKDEIASQVQHEMDREQREVFLREQLRVIQAELGEEDFFQQELTDVRQQILDAHMPEEAHQKALKELSRLSLMSPIAPEVGMVRSYIDWLTGIPWTTETEDQLDIAHAQRILDAQHYGLPKVKDRILEYIAVRKLATQGRNAPILCFVGPPGVGKTSLGKSIAAALGREFVRVSLGGVRDEAEIRGHRRTYIGALPGRIIQTMRRAGTVNPVFMLDEIDKLGNDFRGDPSSALLEVLDPEQNHAFSDHYLDVPYDLSRVVFITTANDLDPLPPALLDRLELIEFTSYSEEEKMAIARQFLIPRQLTAQGLEQHPLRFSNAALQTLIREYTYESGVRNLEREIANICRKVTRLYAEGKRAPSLITPHQVTRFLGPPLFDDSYANDKDEVGVAAGLAWTPVGGDVMLIEATILPGKGNLTLTGSLGDVMQESAQAALTYLRARAEQFGLLADDFENFDIHVHLPEGAVPKEGPSAGITLAAAMVSAFTDRKIRKDIAMTGEITLRGKVLPVGGVKEKVLAARRARIQHVVLPRENRKDLADIPKDVLSEMQLTFVSEMQDVLDLVLLEDPGEGERRIDRLRPEKDASEDEETEAT